MLCVLQVEGHNLENAISQHFAASFYRKDVSRDGRDLLFYDVADASNRSELSLHIRQFIDQNKAALAYALQHPEDVEMMNLDIGIVMDGPLSKSISLDRALVAELGRYGISVSVSAYQGEIVLSDDQP
ncbi:hypothetical protein SAMN05216338_10338 [Bradyrhizobium sp. Rc2d]|uniref:hypothetical protein n=1 Tax=Bradyrhizobium sp. Rc2d TaxID=1855321 RepID=UPI0008899962|nr:hypothetical protein [Bradyrhizobium sp. Rc2d]SDI89962.1 hypothetical protein SAMN05216338_10338 [Bradyrhizobium sp. Rc2d]